jgi:hypothetical protein
MLAKYPYFLPALLLLVFCRPAPAQAAQEPKSRDVLVKESIANVDSDDVHVAAQAARYLGIFRAAEGVPALLRVLQSPRRLSLLKHHMAADKDSVSEWVLFDVKGEIITALGLIGDKRAVPALKRYLKKPPAHSEVFPGNVAFALYQLTGRSYKYKDRDGRMKLFQPSDSTNAPAH